MNNPGFVSYTRNNGTDEFQTYLNSLDDRNGGKMIATINNINEHGIVKAHAKRWIASVGKHTDILEVRCHVNNNQRRGICFLDHQRNQFVLLTGFTKKDQKIKQSQIKRWEGIRDEYLKHQYQKGANTHDRLKEPSYEL